jgi:hypothetical protein
VLAIIDPLPPPRFVLNRGVLKYWRSEAEWRSNSAPLKDALYRLSHCDVNGSGDGDGRGGASSGGDQKQQTRFSFSLPSAPSFSTTTPMFGIILQPRNAQGGPRRSTRAGWRPSGILQPKHHQPAAAMAAAWRSCSRGAEASSRVWFFS